MSNLFSFVFLSCSCSISIFLCRDYHLLMKIDGSIKRSATLSCITTINCLVQWALSNCDTPFERPEHSLLYLYGQLFTVPWEEFVLCGVQSFVLQCCMALVFQCLLCLHGNVLNQHLLHRYMLCLCCILCMCGDLWSTCCTGIDEKSCNFITSQKNWAWWLAFAFCVFC